MTPADRRCARCAGPLPTPHDVLVIVHPADGSIAQTCSAACMVEWLDQGAVGLRRSIRRSIAGGRWRLLTDPVATLREEAERVYAQAQQRRQRRYMHGRRD